MRTPLEINRIKWGKVSDTIKQPKCLLCSEPACVVLYTPNGCTCAENIIQPRCDQHFYKIQDTDDFYIIEDFRVAI